MERTVWLRWILLVCSVIATTAHALQPSKAFSARAVQQSPDHPERVARMHVSELGVRMEYDQQAQKMVEIYNLAERRAWLVMPDQKIYSEKLLPEGAPMNTMSQQHEENPCTGLSEVTCVRLGEESINGQSVVLWEMTGMLDGRKVSSLHWLDRTRHMPVRQLWHDGTAFEVKIQGQEILYGRTTEKWELVTTRANGEVLRSWQWYDPELKITVREKLPGGYLRELQDIKVAPQPEALFKVPAGFRLTVLPADSHAGQGPGRVNPYGR